MKIIFAPDSFKDSMTAKEAAISMEKGFKKVYKKLDSSIIPMADGGEGTKDVLVDSDNGSIKTFKVPSLIGEMIEVEIGILDDGRTIVIDSAAVVGVELLEQKDKNPLETTTYGLGQLIRYALDLEPDNIIIGLGGSGTNDGGVGMIMGLGGEVLNLEGESVDLGGKGLIEIYEIDLNNIDGRLKDVNIIGAYDVENPLTGNEGATRVYASQKGANENMIEELEKGMENYKLILNELINKDINKIKGSGAAGGLGAGIVGLLEGELKSGIDVVLNLSNFRERIKGADIIVTGEGKLDYQTRFGKTPLGVAQVARKEEIPVIGIAGHLDIDNRTAYEMGFHSIFSISKGPVKLSRALKNGKENMETLCENIAKLMEINRP